MITRKQHLDLVLPQVGHFVTCRCLHKNISWNPLFFLMSVGATFLLKLQTKPKEQLLPEMIAIKKQLTGSNLWWALFSAYVR
jgi:hypothetical protein